MTLKENIRAILECNFPGIKDEIIDVAVERIMELSDIQKEGRWIDIQGINKKYESIFKCSCCQNNSTNKHYKYCPNCGAEMKGLANE